MLPRINRRIRVHKKGPRGPKRPRGLKNINYRRSRSK